MTTPNIENYLPIVQYNGLNTAKNISLNGSANFDASGSTGTFKFPSGAVSGQKSNVVSGSAATVTLTASQSGSTVLFDSAAGIVFTLPASTVGLFFDFVTTVTITSGSATVTVPASSFMLGAVELLTSASAVTFAAYGNGTSHVSIASNGTTTGGIKGSQYRVTCISATVWNVTGLLAGSGALATPFA